MLSEREETSIPSRERVVEMVRKWGGPTSDAVLDPAMLYFEHPGIQGVMGYRIKRGCAIVFGDPICADSDRATLAVAFHRFAEEHQTFHRC